jgi:hypothetical protein
MYLHNVTFVEMGRHMGGISGSGAQMSLKRERMPLRHYNALTQAFPDLPIALLPEPRDVPSGPRPNGLPLSEVGA